MCIYIYVCIYIYTKRDIDAERDKESERNNRNLPGMCFAEPRDAVIPLLARRIVDEFVLL